MKINLFLASTLAIVLIAGMVGPAFANFDSGTRGPSIPRGSPSVIITQQSSQSCNTIDFEGVGDFNPVGIIGAATFSPNVEGLVDSDAGGGGNFANEPSPSTIAVVFSDSNPFTVTLANPVQEVSFFYTTFVQGTVNFRDSGNNIINTQALPVTPDGPGDPLGAGPSATWIAITHNAGSSTIKSVEIIQQPGSGPAIDDFTYCETLVGGESLSIDNSALLLAGISTSAIWMIPTLAGIAGLGFYLARFRITK